MEGFLQLLNLNEKQIIQKLSETKRNFVKWTANGTYTWTVPSGVQYVNVYMESCSGGGGGGGGITTAGGGKGGDGYWGYFANIYIGDQTSITIKVPSVGGGGIGGDAAGRGGGGGGAGGAARFFSTVLSGGAGGGGSGGTTGGFSGGAGGTTGAGFPATPAGGGGGGGGYNAIENNTMFPVVAGGYGTPSPGSTAGGPGTATFTSIPNLFGVLSTTRSGGAGGGSQATGGIGNGGDGLIALWY